jgi:hypothetical protein
VVDPEGFTSHSKVDSAREVRFAVPVLPGQQLHVFRSGILVIIVGPGLWVFREETSYPVHQGDERGAPMSGPEGPTTNTEQSLAEPGVCTAPGRARR